MELNEIKKKLYMQKPTAYLKKIRNGIAYYECIVKEDSETDILIKFEVPVNDMGTAEFFPEMEAHLLIRWINFVF